MLIFPMCTLHTPITEASREVGGSDPFSGPQALPNLMGFYNLWHSHRIAKLHFWRLEESHDYSSEENLPFYQKAGLSVIHSHSWGL